MRRQNHVVELAESMRLGDRLVIEAIQCCSRDLPVPQCDEQSVFVDNSASCRIQQVGVAFHLRDLVCADQAARLLVERAVN